MAEKYIFCLDLGTGGATCGLLNPLTAELYTGESSDYEILRDGDFMIQDPRDWVRAVQLARKSLQETLDKRFGAGSAVTMFQRVKGVGLGAQMHGLVPLPRDRHAPLQPCILYCDPRGAQEGKALTAKTGIKVPGRFTVSRIPWLMMNDRTTWDALRAITVPSGFLMNLLTGENTIGVGEASGVCPLTADLEYDEAVLRAVVDLGGSICEVPELLSLLPKIKKAGEVAGHINVFGEEILGVPKGTPVFPTLGDQQAAVVGCHVTKPGQGAASCGTSNCMNVVAEYPLDGIEDPIDPFRTDDGQNMDMVWRRGGSILYERMVKETMEGLTGLGMSTSKNEVRKMFDTLALQVPPGANGVMAFPFTGGGEQGLGYELESVSGGFVGLTDKNCTLGARVRAALEASIFTLKIGVDRMLANGIPIDEVVLTGGVIYATDDLFAKMFANILNVRVIILAGAGEGSCLGAGIEAAYGVARMEQPDLTLAKYVDAFPVGEKRVIEPDPAIVEAYREVFVRWYNSMCDHYPEFDLE